MNNLNQELFLKLKEMKREEQTIARIRLNDKNN